ncbi:hypothetical protein BB558_000464 [Smittium angustum]|uniref:Uncharacterized protein n=1 Tax=Smittium angustum TaxID=133377 RepID=A0A2U1JEA5_SMIAN|nr:hypothetical protein BB558_000464 [Smittium angustum]
MLDKTTDLKIPESQSEILKLSLSEDSDGKSQNAKISKIRRTAPGKLASNIYNVGLALMKLEVVTEYEKYYQNNIKNNKLGDNFQPLVVKNTDNENLYVLPWFPSWWP